MEEQIEPKVEEIQKEPRWRTHFWPVVIAVLITMAILISVGYYWQLQSNKKQKALESYIYFLQNPTNTKTQ